MGVSAHSTVFNIMNEMTGFKGLLRGFFIELNVIWGALNSEIIFIQKTVLYASNPC